jgi:MinD superfamily P-loop ATPase
LVHDEEDYSEDQNVKHWVHDGSCGSCGSCDSLCRTLAFCALDLKPVLKELENLEFAIERVPQS